MQEPGAFERYLEYLETGEFDFFDEDEIEDIVFGFIDRYQADDAEKALNFGLEQHPDSKQLLKLRVIVAIEKEELDRAEELLAPYLNDGTLQTVDLQFSLALHRRKYEESCSHLISGARRGLLPVHEVCDTLEEFWNDIPKDVMQKALYQLGDLSKDDAVGLFCVAFVLVKTGDLTTAVELLNRSLDLDAYNIEAWHSLMGCYFELHEYDKCLETCDYALAIQEKHILIRFVRGFVLTTKKQYERALEDLKFLIDCREGRITNFFPKPDIPIEDREYQLKAGYEMILECYHQLGDSKNAYKYMQKLVKLKPDDANLHYHIALHHMDSGNYIDALVHVNNAIELDGSIISYHAMKASILTSIGELDEALEVIELMLKLDPASKHVTMLAKGEIFMHLGRWKEAQEIFMQIDKMKFDEIFRARITKYLKQLEGL